MTAWFFSNARVIPIFKLPKKQKRDFVRKISSVKSFQFNYLDFFAGQYPKSLRKPPRQSASQSISRNFRL